MSHRPFAIDAHVVDGRPQGSRTVLVQLLRGIARLGRAGDFTLYCRDPDGCARAIGMGGEQFAYELLPPGGPIRRLLRVWPRLLRRAGHPLTLFQYIAPPGHGARSLVAMHDILPITHPRLFPLVFRLRSQLLFRLSILAARRVIAVSRTARTAIETRYPRLRDKIRLVPNGPSFPLEAYGLDQETRRIDAPRYILAVGRIEPRKNIELLVRAFATAGLDEVELIVVGKTDHGHRLDLPPGLRVRHLEQVSDDELIALYRGAALFVFPSAAEGFGIPLLDALLFGVPTISSDRTSMPEVAGGLAWLFDPTTPDAETVLAERVRAHFGGDPIPAPTRGERQAHAQRFGWDEAAQLLVNVFDEARARG